MVIDHAVRTVLEPLLAEIDQQPCGLVEQFHIGKGLPHMQTGDFFNGLQFDDKPVFNKQIDPIGVRKPDAIDKDFDRLLPVNF